jgi:ABC-type branched-subunit amino acid transport system substrate-binding protein
MDLEGGGKGDIDAVVYGLKGAHAAQWRANRTSVRGNLPNIRLVVANFGEKGRHWLFTAEKLVEASRDGQRLVAVTGISRSTAQTAAALNHLSRHRIPQVSDVLTADRIKGDPMLARVAPTNSDQAAAAARWLRGQGVEKVQHVFDRNPDDAYAATLRTAFRTAFGSEGLREEGGAYNSALGDPANLFFAMDANLCGQRDTDTVYFSGRSGPLKEFVEQLGNRTCLERAFTVVTADDATLLLSDDEFDQALRRRIRVVYTGLAHPDVWKHATDSAVHPNTVEFFGDEGWFARTFQGTPLADGHVIMAHDAVLTAVCAIRLGGGQGSDVPRPEDVAQNLHALVGGREVPGASGYISLDERGFARDKAVPVLEIHPGGRITLLTPNPAADPASAPDGR